MSDSKGARRGDRGRDGIIWLWSGKNAYNEGMGELKINEFCLRLSGKCSLPIPLDFGRNYKVSVQGSVTAITDADNHDGSHTRYYKFQPAVIETLTEEGKSLARKDIRSMSQKLRAVLKYTWEHGDKSEEFEEYYQKAMNRILVSVEEFI